MICIYICINLYMHKYSRESGSLKNREITSVYKFKRRLLVFMQVFFSGDYKNFNRDGDFFFHLCN